MIYGISINRGWHPKYNLLFFKIWGMTNNVREMRDYFLREEDAKSNAEKDNYFFNIGEKVVYNGRIYEVSCKVMNKP